METTFYASIPNSIYAEMKIKPMIFLQFKDERDYGQLYLYFAPRTMFSEELELYTSLSLMAEIGGYVGLLLGVSLWHFASWISDMLEVKIKKLESEENQVHPSPCHTETPKITTNE